MLKAIKPSYILSALMVLMAIAIMIIKPISNLDETAHTMLGGIIIALCIWIFKPFNLPYAVGGIVLAFFGLIVGLAPGVVFSGFAQSAVWTLIPALFFGFTLQKTGLGKRIALGIIKLSKPSYVSFVLAWTLINLALSLLTPSITVRVAIVIPIAVQCCELCKLEKGSKGNSLIMLTAFAMALVPGSGLMSGLLAGPIIQGMFDATPQLEGMITFNNWFEVLFLPMMITTVLLVAGSLIFLRPKEKLSKEVINSIKQQPIPKMARHELVAAIVLTLVFLMFLTNRFHGIPDTAVCFAAVFAFFVFGVLESKDFSSGVNWDMVVFIGMAISLGAIFTATGISEWLAGIVIPALRPITGNPWIFMFTIMTVMFLWRFVDVAIFIPTIAILVPILPAIQEAFNINPLVWLAIFIMPSNALFMAYQNIWAMMSKTIAGDRSFTNKHLATYGTLYFAACLITLTVAIPMWINSGLFG